MSARRHIAELLRELEIQDDLDLLETLRNEGLFREDEVSAREADELRVAVVLMREMGVNAAGVDVILRMRGRLIALQRRTEQALRLLLDERRR